MICTVFIFISHLQVTRVTFPEELDVIVCEDDDKRTNDGNYLADQENRLDCINDKFSNPSYQTMHHGKAMHEANLKYRPNIFFFLYGLSS